MGTSKVRDSSKLQWMRIRNREFNFNAFLGLRQRLKLNKSNCFVVSWCMSLDFSHEKLSFIFTSLFCPLASKVLWASNSRIAAFCLNLRSTKWCCSPWLFSRGYYMKWMTQVHRQSEIKANQSISSTIFHLLQIILEKCKSPCTVVHLSRSFCPIKRRCVPWSLSQFLTLFTLSFFPLCLLEHRFSCSIILPDRFLPAALAEHCFLL